eukprot:12905000-Prorocentrum_lima.AAC.1
MARTIRLGYQDENAKFEITQEQRDAYIRTHDEHLCRLEPSLVFTGVHLDRQTPSPTVVATLP